ncbi:MAG: protein kinase [Deltaproteobacteria bacterium]|nr:protein kinase [Deltaproteobacteria bacterium]
MRQIQLKTALGSGAFGTVYKADLLGGQGVRRSVAVKVLSRATRAARCSWPASGTRRGCSGS